jgi:dihydrofolate synthase/folylpolyglutamate synthase
VGEFQQANASLALGALEVLIEQGYKIHCQDIAAGMAKVRWPGRFQVIRRKPLIVLDGAHNPASAGELRKAVRRYAAERNPKIMVAGSSSDKDYRGVAAELAPEFDVIIAARTRHPRALPEHSLAEAFRQYHRNVRTAPTVGAAVDVAIDLAGQHGLVCATGSLFVVGEVLEWARLPGY